MSDTPQTEGPNAEQARYWQSDAGRKWVEHQAALDLALAPVGAILFERAAPAAGEAVLDLGCGTGATTMALAEIVGPGGKVVGLDISPVLLAKARARLPAALAPRVEYVEADAQTADLGRRFDLLISRFGSMFFSDPAAAFGNLRRALRPGARLHLAAWAPLTQNPWFAIPREAAIRRLGPAPAADPKAPGPLAFSDPVYVEDVLRRAGFSGATAEVVAVDLTPPGEIAEVAGMALRLGPAARLMQHYQGTEDDAKAIAGAMIAALDRYRTPQGVRVPAMLNLFAATAP